MKLSYRKKFKDLPPALKLAIVDEIRVRDSTPEAHAISAALTSLRREKEKRARIRSAATEYILAKRRAGK